MTWLFALALLGQPLQDTTGAPVVWAGDTLFTVQVPLGPFNAQDRAGVVMARLTQIMSGERGDGDTVIVADGDGGADIRIGLVAIHTVTEADARAAGVSRAELAAQLADAIRAGLAGDSLWVIIQQVAMGLLFTALAAAILWIALRAVGWVFPRIYARLEAWRTTRIPGIRIQRLELLSASRVTDGMIVAARMVRVAVVILLFFYFIPLVFSFFPWTAGFADTVLDYVTAPLAQVWAAFVGYIPNLFYIAVIVVVTYYGLQFIHFVFDGIDRGALKFPNFFPEWAEPTYKIVRLLVLAFAFIVIFPYLPGSDSQAFRGVSVFLGVLVSFGSAGAVGNLVAGVVITYMRPFKVGDRVKIADTTGDVLEKTLLVTRVRTTKNVDTTIPNAMVLASHIVNYSSIAKDQGVILHTTVTIGYDAHWKRVHQLLLAAADRTDHVLKNPKPFVLQTSLDDFYVSYELNAYTTDPNRMSRTYSDLHQHIQDTFAEAGVEIMSPHYRAERDGSAPAMPQRP